MASGWIHDTLDLIVFGRVYRHVHARKDAYAQHRPGRQHRDLGHEWYLAFGRRWDFNNPFPAVLYAEIDHLRQTQGADVAEERMSSDSHDYLDRIWDDFERLKKLYCEGFFLSLLYDPALLRDWAGVDVLHGKILRRINGCDIWEDSPETVIEYKILRRRVSRNYSHRLKKSQLWSSR